MSWRRAAGRPDRRRWSVHGALRRRVRCRVSTGLGCRGSSRTPASGRAGSLVIALLAGLSAAAPVAGWHLVQDAINNGIEAGDEHRLLLAVIGYVGVNAAAWVLGTLTWLGLADVGQRIVLELRRDLFEHLTSLSLRYFSQQKAGWIISRLTSDVDALSDVLNQGLTTLVVNTLTLRRRCRRPLPARLAARARRPLRAAARHRRSHAGSSASRTTPLRGADADRDRDGAAGRVRRWDGCDPGLQPRTRLPGRVRRAERGEPRRERPRAEDLLGLLPGDRAARRDRDRRGHLRRRAVPRRRLAADRHADRGGRPARTRLPAAPGAFRALRPGAGRERCDGQDQLGARRRDRRRRPPGRPAARPDRRPARARPGHLRLRRRARAALGRHLGARRAGASRSSASPAAASRRRRS